MVTHQSVAWNTPVAWSLWHSPGLIWSLSGHVFDSHPPLSAKMIWGSQFCESVTSNTYDLQLPGLCLQPWLTLLLLYALNFGLIFLCHGDQAGERTHDSACSIFPELSEVLFWIMRMKRDQKKGKQPKRKIPWVRGKGIVNSSARDVGTKNDNKIKMWWSSALTVM